VNLRRGAEDLPVHCVAPGPSSETHSSGLEPLKLMRTCGNTKCPFSRSSCSKVFSPDASARASSSRERCFSRARLLGSRRSGFIPTRYGLAAFAQMVPWTRRAVVDSRGRCGALANPSRNPDVPRPSPAEGLRVLFARLRLALPG
jgi:hypothetical protein